MVNEICQAIFSNHPFEMKKGWFFMLLYELSPEGEMVLVKCYLEGMEDIILDMNWKFLYLPLGYSFGRSPQLCRFPTTQCKRLCDGCGWCHGELPF